MSASAGRRLAAIITLAAVALAATSISASAGSRPAPAAAPATEANIVQTAVAAGNFKTLVRLAKRAGLAEALSGPGPLTVFAPTDAAFAKVPKATLDKLLRNRTLLRRVLLYHVVAGDVRAAQVVKLRRAKTLAKKPIRITVRGGTVYLNRTTRVVATDIGASNGVVHVLDSVLIPPA